MKCTKCEKEIEEGQIRIEVTGYVDDEEVPPLKSEEGPSRGIFCSAKCLNHFSSNLLNLEFESHMLLDLAKDAIGRVRR